MEILSRMFASWIFVIYHLFVSFQFTGKPCSKITITQKLAAGTIVYQGFTA